MLNLENCTAHLRGLQAHSCLTKGEGEGRGNEDRNLKWHPSISRPFCSVFAPTRRRQYNKIVINGNMFSTLYIPSLHPDLLDSALPCSVQQGLTSTDCTNWAAVGELTGRRLDSERRARPGYLLPQSPSLPECNALATSLLKATSPVSYPLHTSTPGFSKPLVPSCLGVARISKSPCIKHP